LVVIFAIVGGVAGRQSAAGAAALVAIATAAALALPAAFALLSLDRRPSLLLAAVIAAAVIGTTIPESLPVWLIAGGAWIFAIRGRPRPLREPRWARLGRPLLAVTVVVPLIFLFAHADPACTVTTDGGRVEQLDPAVRGLQSGWRWGFSSSSLSVSSSASSAGEGTTQVEECSSDRVMPWEALSSLAASGLIIALAFRWPAPAGMENRVGWRQHPAGGPALGSPPERDESS
jgi:hypothetical protein